jgi:hypothetical protein
MSLFAQAASPQTIVRLLLTLFALVLGLAALLPMPAYAFENKAFGDVVVESGEIESEVAAGSIPSERLPAARYKIQEQSYLSEGLADEEISRRARELGVTIRTVRVH